MNLTLPNENAPECGDTFISIVERNGHVYAVDQHGKMINGLLAVSVKTAVDSLTEATLTVQVYKLSE